MTTPGAAQRARLARQPALGLAGITLVVPVMLFLGLGWGGAERSLLVLGPMSTFGLPVIAMIAFWWEDWPGTVLRPPLSGLTNTVLVAVGGIALTVAGQAVVAHVDLRGIFDPAAGAAHSPTFPATMPLAGAIFVVMLEVTLVSEGRPLRRLGRFAGGVAALAASWGIGVALYETVVKSRPRDAGATLVCIGALQVVFYVVLRGRPFAGLAPRTLRLAGANAAVIAGGWLIWLALSHGGGLSPPTINALAGCAVAAGLVVGMLFEDWLASDLVQLAAVASLAALLYVALNAYANALGWIRAEPREWVAYAGLNAIGAGVILHVAVGRRWPFMPPR
jgi:hypothetical protein